jgi:hypothetical protein
MFQSFFKSVLPAPKPTLKSPVVSKPGVVMVPASAKMTAEKLLAHAIRSDDFFNTGCFTHSISHRSQHGRPAFVCHRRTFSRRSQLAERC